MKITAPYSLYLSPDFAALSQVMMLFNVDRKRSGNDVIAEVDHDFELVTLDLVKQGTAAGALIENYPAYIEMTPAAYAGDVPEGIPNRMTTAEDGETQEIRTWSEWRDATHQHWEYDGKHYFGSNASDGRELNGVELVIVDGLDGARVIEAGEFKSIRDQYASMEGVA